MNRDAQYGQSRWSQACCCGNGKAAARAARSGENYTYIHDPDGNMIELVYRPLGLVATDLRAGVKSINGPYGGVFVAPAKAGAQVPPAG